MCCSVNNQMLVEVWENSDIKAALGDIFNYDAEEKISGMKNETLNGFADMNKIASMARNAYARCINPVGETSDGDTTYAVSAGTVKADINTTGTLASRVMGNQ